MVFRCCSNSHTRLRTGRQLLASPRLAPSTMAGTAGSGGNGAGNAHAPAPGPDGTFNSTGNVRGGASWWLRVITLILRILLWPLRVLSGLLFPSGDYDGLSPAVTSKAVQSFENYLIQLATANMTMPTMAASQQQQQQQQQLTRDAFHGAMGFHALRTEAANSNSLILVYLHSPLLRQSDQICKKLLLDDAVLNFIAAQPNLLAMGVSIHTAQGANLAQVLSATSYPVLALLQPSSSSSSSSSSRNNNSNSIHLLFQAQGPLLQSMAPLQLLGYIQTSVQRNQAILDQQEAQRIVREQEAQLRREQDAEYQETLRQDQERQRLQQEALDRERRLQEEAQQQQEEQETQKRNKIQTAKSRLQPEPSSGGTRVRFVLPSGQKVDRRFQSEETVQVLRSFLIVHFHEQAIGIENFGISTNYPKRSYEETDNDKTLVEAGIAPQAVLMVQDLDA